ncbi:HU family DNA-binding protein [Catenovulum agarivorans]|uniref:HU family DNA-binding protein n=1 Tax=Catenovulum agarivorans TaxID=1172192 RepID=UPI0003155FCB|nr:HU family DNA-binding protein [Catenovulum agarivorans]
MNKSELVKKIADGAELSQAQAGKALNVLMDTVTEELAAGNRIELIGFGTFSVKHRAARTGRNPSTGQPIEISAANVPSFKAGKNLKDVCNA